MTSIVLLLGTRLVKLSYVIERLSALSTSSYSSSVKKARKWSKHNPLSSNTWPPTSKITCGRNLVMVPIAPTNTSHSYPSVSIFIRSTDSIPLLTQKLSMVIEGTPSAGMEEPP